MLGDVANPVLTFPFLFIHSPEKKKDLSSFPIPKESQLGVNQSQGKKALFLHLERPYDC